jgi:hypothetical protein
MSTEQCLFQDGFNDLTNWHLDGTQAVSIPQPGVMRLDCTGSRQGGVGCMAFCRTDFPDPIAVMYDLLVHQSNGLVITFLAMRGLNGEDMITGLPPRQGIFGDYVAEDARLRSYHVSVSRYDDAGEHTGVSNWRRNPGCHLMAQGPDLCRRIGRRYAIRIEKDGPRLALFVDGQPGASFTDPLDLPDAMPSEGKVGFRAIGSKVIADIAHVRVARL